MGKYFFNITVYILCEKVKPSVCIIRNEGPEEAIRLLVSLFSREIEFEIVRGDKTIFLPYYENKIYKLL